MSIATLVSWLWTGGPFGMVQVMSGVVALVVVSLGRYVWLLLILPYRASTEELDVVQLSLDSCSARTASLERLLAEAQNRAAKWREIDLMQLNLIQSEEMFRDMKARINKHFLSEPSTLTAGQDVRIVFSPPPLPNLRFLPAPPELERQNDPQPVLAHMPEGSRMRSFDPAVEANQRFIAAAQSNIQATEAWMLQFRTHLGQLRDRLR